MLDYAHFDEQRRNSENEARILKRRGNHKEEERPLLARVVSLGCAKNLVDSEVAAGSLLVHGFGLAPEEEEADVLWINTCAFLKEARREAESVIRRACVWKKARKGRRICVAGCLPEWDRDGTCRKKFPDVDAWLGIDSVADAGRAARAICEGTEGISSAPCEKRWICDEDAPRALSGSGHCAYVKVADGCDNHCAYCLIPSIRGSLRSRTVESVVAEAKNLLDMGVRELVLIAQDTGAFGRDRTGKSELPRLLDELDRLDGDFLLRVMYVHPASISDDMIDAFRRCRRLVRCIETPVQHVSEPILSAMNRHVSESKLRETLRKLREAGFALRTTLMVGFPGETEEDFEKLKELVSAGTFERLGVFVYSAEPETPAAAMKDAVPAHVAAARRDALMKIQAGLSKAANARLVGSAVETIVDELRGSGRAIGRLLNDAPEVDQCVHLRSCPRSLRPGDVVRVRVTKSETYDLYGVCEA